MVSGETDNPDIYSVAQPLKSPHSLIIVRQKTRLIIIDGTRLRWRLRRLHIAEPHEQLLIFPEGTSNRYLSIAFPASELGGPTYIPDRGILVLYPRPICLNLNLPKTVAILCRYAMQSGWDQHSVLKINDGCQFVLNMPEHLLSQINLTP